ncbi:MAG: HNH endonuclease [Candidatus Promineofilum sp.]|nr:HNH endonuclease [Promineifilum sp.]
MSTGAKRTPIPRKLREQVLERDNHTCRYCGRRSAALCIDHVYPVARGGATTIENLVAACGACNSKKQDRLGIWPIPLAQAREVIEPTLIRPDDRFDVAVAWLPLGNGFYVIARASRRVLHRQVWQPVPGAQILLVGDVTEPLARMIAAHTNEWMGQVIGLHPMALRVLRQYLGIAAAGGHGGARPGAGQKKRNR